ncbi:PTS transporter subunit EIIC [Candidatus Stoquefichus sp. SB1]|uniref:PTS transporter subunit EIIC n=1 Tax=Candidatus Stoquefichus sp. SB1 TaxID=1658109 RepID=UPI00067E8C7D|nr:PTS transporter subunit EIIC [Candidatus Stoquefichus sp. SB1]
MSKKMYKDLVNNVLDLIGGKDNLVSLTHCVTRLRFSVKDKSLIEKEKIEQTQGVMGVQWVGEQLQIIIGRDVDEVYKQICENHHIEVLATIEEDLDDGQPHKKSNQFLEVLANIFTPLVYAFSAGGMIKCIAMFLEMLNILPTNDGTLIVLNALGDAPFYFMPFMIGYTTAKQFKINEIFGIMVAGCLMYPTFLNQTAGQEIQFLFLKIPCLSYASTVLPVLLSVILFSFVYKFVDRFVPKSLNIIFTGFLSMAISAPIMLCLIAPVGNYCGTFLAQFLETFFTTFGPVAGAVFAGSLSFYVMTGMHYASMTLMMQNLALLGYDYLMPAIFINNIAVAGATLGASLHIKKKEMKSAAVSNGAIALLGISEPALYGIDFKYKYPLVGIVAGGVVAGALYMILGVKCYAFGPVGLTSFPQYMKTTANLIGIVVCVAVSFIVSFLSSYFFGRKYRGDE